MSLEISGLHKSFRRADSRSSQHVLRGIDLSVAPGEFVSLIGHSGCGKSTLLNLVAGLIAADAGAIELDGRPVTGPGPDRAVVFQNYSLLPRLSLLDNVRTAARAARPERPRAETDAAVEHYLRAVGMWEHRSKRPGQVSGGMQQRAAVSRAFAVGPKLLLLDEPFGAVDALTRARLQQQLTDVWSSESGTETVLMVTHGIDEAILLADRIVIMGSPPGPSVLETIPVPIPRPRDRVSIVKDPAFREIQSRLLAILEQDSSLAA